MARRSRCGGISLVLLACTCGDKESDSGHDDPYEWCLEVASIPGCPKGTTTPNMAYPYGTSNWSCEHLPVSVPFDVGASTFAKHAGIAIDTDVSFTMKLYTSASNAHFVSGEMNASVARVAQNGKSHILMTPSHSEDGFLAEAFRWSDGAGTATECDIIFYETSPEGYSRRWKSGMTVRGGVIRDDVTGVLTSERSQYGVLPTLVHEVGHCAGFSHPLCPAMSDSVMHKYISDVIQFSAEDNAALVYLYGERIPIVSVDGD